MPTTAVILAGGIGRRMGGMNKAMLSYGDEAFIERQIRVASLGTDEIIVVSNDQAISSLLHNRRNVTIIPDVYIGEGPLAGLHAGLSAASYSSVWVLGCDQPFLDVAAALYLQDRMESGSYQAALPIFGGRPQPLHALYRKETMQPVQALLELGERKILSLLDHIPWCGIDESEFKEQGIPLNFVDDVDTPEQYAEARLLFDDSDNS
ncbi:molybdenum cofactor guanylyltransferase [Cohnella sp.]|uniref:molybdenum cofactor guanylyltransferase n=1 Tax=Cohnella sp. TaxID=1883426 RepID=UPI0035640100